MGFIVTILGVRKAERAAEEARRAAREVVVRVKSQLISNEIEASIRFFREIDRACRESRWDEAADRCDDARACLSRLHNDRQLSESERDSIDSANKFLGGFLNYILRLRKSDPPKDVASQKSIALHDKITALDHISGRLRSVTLEF